MGWVNRGKSTQSERACRWYAVLVYENGGQLPDAPGDGPVVGVDVGIKVLAFTSAARNTTTVVKMVDFSYKLVVSHSDGAEAAAAVPTVQGHSARENIELIPSSSHPACLPRTKPEPIGSASPLPQPVPGTGDCKRRHSCPETQYVHTCFRRFPWRQTVIRRSVTTIPRRVNAYVKGCAGNQERRRAAPWYAAVVRQPVAP